MKAETSAEWHDRIQSSKIKRIRLSWEDSHQEAEKVDFSYTISLIVPAIQLKLAARLPGLLAASDVSNAFALVLRDE